MNTEVQLIRTFAERYPEEVARHVELSLPEAFAEVLAALGPEHAGSVLTKVSPLAAAAALAKLETKTCASTLEATEPWAAAGIMLRMTKIERDRTFGALSAKRARELKTLTEYGRDCAAGRLDPRAPALPEQLKVSEAFERLRAFPSGVLNYVYIVDAEFRLTGVVNMRELMLADTEAQLSAIMTRNPDALLAHDTLELVVQHAAWKHNHALPVVDRQRRFLGALRYSTFRTIEAELGQTLPGADTGRTASALAELLTLGTLAMGHFVSSGFALENRSATRLSERPQRATGRAKDLP